MNKDIDKALDKINEHTRAARSTISIERNSRRALRSMIGGGTQAPPQR
jgi:hypothetical protein